MATKEMVLFASPLDGTEVDITYDDVSLQASTLTFVVPHTLGAPLQVIATNPQLNGGNQLVWQAPPSQNPKTYTFDPPLQGSLFTSKFGTHVTFGFSQIAFGAVGAVTPNNATIIHV